MSAGITNRKKTVSANILVRNEIQNIKGLVENLIDSEVDEILFLDGGSIDGTYEYLEELEKKYNNIIKLFRWPQPIGSDYKIGFNEVERRNFLIDQSNSQYILYIDADERISTNFKDALEFESDIFAVSLCSYWNGLIRVNSKKDKVWYPLGKYRIFKNKRNLRFSSRDKNGLHNYLAYMNIKIPVGLNKSIFFLSVARVWLFLIPIKVTVLINEITICHYHYYYLNRKKINDLRSNEFNWMIRENKGQLTGEYDEVVYVSSEITEKIDVKSITKKYWLDFQGN